MTIGDRIKTVRGSESQDSFAARIAINKASLGFYERNERAPKAATIGRIAEVCGVSTRWLILGEGPMRKGEASAVCEEKAPYGAEPRALPIADCADSYQIPLVDDMPSAGNGNDLLETEPRCYYPFPASWLRKKGNPKDMLLMEVSGDSMEPEIKHGDLVMLDRGKTRPMGGRFFVVRLEGSLYVKRMEVLPRKLLLVSLNKSYTPIEVDMTKDVTDSVQIIGQIIWLSREMR